MKAIDPVTGRAVSPRCHAITRTGSTCLRSHAVIRLDRAGHRRFGGAPVCDRHERLFSRRPGGARYPGDVSWSVRGGYGR